MGENQVVRQVRFSIQVIAAAPNASTGIDHDNVSAPGPDFKAGGVAPVSQKRFARNRNGPPGSPATDKHDMLITSDSVNPYDDILSDFTAVGGRKK
jgi:hypothetical protein